MTDTLIVAPKQINFELPPHADVILEFQVADSAGRPVDITNDTVRFVAYKSLRDPAILISKINASGGHSDPVNGKTRFTIAAADTSFVSLAEYSLLYEVWREYGASQSMPWFKGIMLFQALRGTEA